MKKNQHYYIIYQDSEITTFLGNDKNEDKMRETFYFEEVEFDDKGNVFHLARYGDYHAKVDGFKNTKELMNIIKNGETTKFYIDGEPKEYKRVDELKKKCLRKEADEDGEEVYEVNQKIYDYAVKDTILAEFKERLMSSKIFESSYHNFQGFKLYLKNPARTAKSDEKIEKVLLGFARKYPDVNQGELLAIIINDLFINHSIKNVKNIEMEGDNLLGKLDKSFEGFSTVERLLEYPECHKDKTENRYGEEYGWRRVEKEYDEVFKEEDKKKIKTKTQKS